MDLLRYASADGAPALGVRDDAGIAPLPGVESLARLLRLRVAEIRELISAALTGARLPFEGIEVLAPVDGNTEVWGAGVTYERSFAARVEESGGQDAYALVYEAERPELFFKSVAWRVIGSGAVAGLRRDATSTVPEPELALVVNRHGEILGATVCDDLTARSIEGQNPLYLPQAKLYTGSCVLGAGIRPWWEISDPHALTITLLIRREGATVFSGSTNTSVLRRRFEDLVAWLYREERFPEGVVLATGTGIVPELDFSLEAGDEVEITIEHVGTLTHGLAHIAAEEQDEQPRGASA
jgi:2-dehydro-3-deoxy-D-arabinonate dehydratase